MPYSFVKNSLLRMGYKTIYVKIDFYEKVAIARSEQAQLSKSCWEKC